jgi:hypothetical protein
VVLILAVLEAQGNTASVFLDRHFRFLYIRFPSLEINKMGNPILTTSLAFVITLR